MRDIVKSADTAIVADGGWSSGHQSRHPQI